MGKMKAKVFLFCALLCAIEEGEGIVMKESSSSPLLNFTRDNWQCLGEGRENEDVVEVGESVFRCAKKNLYVSLLNNVDQDCVDIGEGLTFLKEEATENPTARDIFPHGEPSTFRGLLSAYSTFLSQRSARWDLGFLYPGLVMRIGPTLNGAGIVEFGLEKRLDYNDRAQLGPGQLIIRRTILPRLLGFRMNLSQLFPIIFAIILFVTKNAFLFTKITLGLSALLTLKSLFLLQVFNQQQPQNHNNHHHHPHPVHRPPVHVPHDPVDLADTITITPNRPRPQGYSVGETLSETVVSQMLNTFPPYKELNEKSSHKKRKTGKRNFSWEKK